jgi:hypothetical protein
MRDDTKFYQAVGGALAGAHLKGTPMNALAKLLGRTGLLRHDLDYHLLRAAMVIIFAWFGYDKWFESVSTENGLEQELTAVRSSSDFYIFTCRQLTRR